jgi:tyrosyl-tRNA synthetase
MDIQERIDLITRCPTEEVVRTEELEELFEVNSTPRHYVGLEISGKLHLGSLVLTGFKINDFIKANVKAIVFLADWHSYINNKLGGNWEKIDIMGKYYADAFNFFCPGVQIVTGSELYSKCGVDYCQDLIRFSKHLTLARATRSLTIMGRTEKDALDLSQLLYPPMQSADIKALGIDIVHAGMDQRKIHMLVREVFPKLNWRVPVMVHHHLLPGLSEPAMVGQTDSLEETYISSKMSKSKPSGGIAIHDDEKTIHEKIRKAYCPIDTSEGNPVLELINYIIFHEFSHFTIERSSKHGGNVTYYSKNDVTKDFLKKKIHPMDLKNAVAVHINRIVEPIRKHFVGREPQFS